MLHLGSRLSGCMPGSCGCGGKFVLLPKNLENIATFSEFLCPPRLLGSNSPPALLVGDSASLTGRAPYW